MKRVVAALAAVALLVSCGDDDDGEGGARSSTAADSLTALLGSVPDSVANRDGELYYANLNRVRVGQPAASTGDDDLRTLMSATSFSLRLPSRYNRCFADAECVAELGFDTRAIAASIEFGAIPDLTEVLVGEFSADDLRKSLEATPGGDGTRVTTADGATLLSLGVEGQSDIGGRSAFRPIGNPVTVGVGGPGLVSANEQALVEQALAVDQDDSLAADPSYAAVARELDAAEVDVAIVLPGIEGATWLLGGLGEEVTADEDSDTPDSAVVTYVFLFADEAAAQSGADAFRTIVETGMSSVNTPWSESLTVTSSTVNGAVLVITLQATTGGWWYDPLARRENLLVF